jgi:GNAT superfamily N-acetyltransferase
MTDIIYEDYPYTCGERKDTKLNKRILSLARRHNFYLNQVQSVLNGGGWSIRPKSYQVCVAKKLNKKKDYKVVGFIIYEGKHFFGGRGDRMCMSLEYWLVDSKFQGQGIGKGLYAEMEKTAESYGLKNYCVMFKKNDPVLAELYAKKGYTFIPKYDGIVNETQQEKDNHIKLYKIVVSTYRTPDDGTLWDLLE